MKPYVRWWYGGFVILLFIYLFVLQLQAIWPFTIDDMYISLRYAKNWAAGHGLLWNLGAPPVEGYSNFSFVVLATWTLLLHGDPVFVLKIAGAAGLLATCACVYALTRFWFFPREALLSWVILLLYQGQIIWAASGLETTVYEALICGAVYYCFRGMGYQHVPLPRQRAQPKFFIAGGFLLAVAGMTRPEAPALMLMCFVLFCWDYRQNANTTYWYGLLLFIGTLGALFFPYFAWRLYYFGYLFPNSVYCKGFSSSLAFSLDTYYLWFIWPFMVLALPACFSNKDKRHYFLWLPSLIYLAMLINSEPLVAFENRLFLPAFALLIPLSLQGLRSLIHYFLPKEDGTFWFFFYFCVFWLAFLFVPVNTLEDYRYFSQNPVQGEHLRMRVINWLQINASKDDSVVLADSGMIPYYSNLKFIDSYCLNNVAMAHYAENERYPRFCQEIMHTKPAIVILTSLVEKGQVWYTPSDLCFKNLLHPNGYQLTDTFISQDKESTYRYELFTIKR